METKTWERTEDGQIIDPPIIREYERRIEDAKSAGDTEMVAFHTKEYTDERDRVVAALEAQEPVLSDAEQAEAEAADKAKAADKKADQK